MPKRSKQVNPSSPLSNNFGTPFSLEILTNIFTILLYNDRRTLAVCCRLSRAFFTIASPILYSRIGISSHSSRDSRADHSLDKLTTNGRTRATTRKKKLLKHAQYITVDAHDSSTICNFATKGKTHNFPQLKVLTLCLTINATGPILHTDIVHSRPKVSQQYCNLIKNLRMSPKKIVVDGSNMTSIFGHPFGFPQNIWDEVEEVTFICPPINFLPDPAVGGFPEWSHLPLKKVNWIFFTKDRNSTWTLGRHHLNPDKREYGSGKFEDEYWSFGNFLLSFPSAVEIRIINSGMIHPYTIGSEHRDENYNQSLFAHKVRQSMLMEIQTRFSKNQQQKTGNDGSSNGDSGMSLEDQYKKTDDRWSAIRWMGMKEYLKNNDWVGELEPSEVKVWLNQECY